MSKLRDHISAAWFDLGNSRAGMAVRNRAYVIRHSGSGPAMTRVRGSRLVRTAAPRTPVVRNRIDRATGHQWRDSPRAIARPRSGQRTRSSR